MANPNATGGARPSKPQFPGSTGVSRNKFAERTPKVQSTPGSVAKMLSRVSNLGITERDRQQAKAQATYNAQRAGKKVWDNGMTN